MTEPDPLSGAGTELLNAIDGKSKLDVKIVIIGSGHYFWSHGESG